MSAYGFKKRHYLPTGTLPSQEVGGFWMVWSNNLYGSKGISGKARVNRGGIKLGWIRAGWIREFWVESGWFSVTLHYLLVTLG